MILIIDMNSTNASLGYYEFVTPILSITEKLDKCTVRHYSTLKQEDINNSSKIILSGSALKNHVTLNQTEKFEWIKNYTKPILGICAGMQNVGLAFGSHLKECLEIGMINIKTLKENPLFSSAFKAYALHNYSLQPSKEFHILAKSNKCAQAIKHKQKPIYGVLFHPEVRNKDIIQRFTLMKN